jgi:glycosyltransferase involved in cell wall biosynthesis
MKILRVISSVSPRGGGPIEGIRQITPFLTRQGHTTEVVCLDPPTAPWLPDFPLLVHALGPGWGNYRYSPRLTPWLRAHAHEYDAVIVHGLWQYSSFGTWRALHDSQTPYFVYTHGMLDPWFKTTYPLKHLKKCLYWPWADYRVLQDARAVFFTSEEERRMAKQSFSSYQCREIVVNYGTSSPQGDPVVLRRRFFESHPDLAGKKLLLFLSRIHPKKGCDLLLKAFARVAASDPNLHLVLAGPDDTGWQEKLEFLARTLDIAQRVTWTGMLSGEQKWSAFHAADAFILPSHQENFGIAVAEALACGLPVLISDKINIWREILADEAGLVAPDTEDGTPQLLQRWLAMTPEQCQKMRANARCCFLTRFEIGEAAESFASALQASHA